MAGLGLGHSGKQPCSRRYAAFTLIELLVVVAIVVILIGVLLSSLRLARIQSRRVACQANLHSIGQGFHAYFSESGDRFPQGINLNLFYGGWSGVMAALPRPLNESMGLPAVAGADSAKVYRCPADTGGEPAAYPTAFDQFGNSYSANPILVGQNRLPERGRCEPLHKRINTRLSGLSVTQVDEPSRLLLLGDYGWVNQRSPDLPFRTEWHFKACHHNLLFLDGHAAFVHIRKGPYITKDYRFQPFKDLDDLARTCQKNKPCGPHEQ